MTDSLLQNAGQTCARAHVKTASSLCTSYLPNQAKAEPTTPPPSAIRDTGCANPVPPACLPGANALSESLRPLSANIQQSIFHDVVCISTLLQSASPTLMLLSKKPEAPSEPLA
ncbi:hypothetical protein VDGL01_01199 [Verticillium dahliae]